MFTTTARLVVILLFCLYCTVDASVSADNVRDFDPRMNEIASGRWAYGWFNQGSANNPRSELRLFTQTFSGSKLAQPNWAVDDRNVVVWALAADGSAYADGADLAWIYTVPEQMAGKVRLKGRASGGGEHKQLRIYTAQDVFFTGMRRDQWKPLFEQKGNLIDFDTVINAPKGTLIFFVQNDTGKPANLRVAQKLKVNISKED